MPAILKTRLGNVMLLGTRDENEHETFRHGGSCFERQDRTDPEPVGRVTTVTVVVIDGFSMLSLAAIIEPFNQANRADGTDHFRWRLVGILRKSATASCGIEIELSDDLASWRPDASSLREHLVVVCAGNDVDRHVSSKTRSFLRGVARKGATLAGVGTGAWMIADADLLEEKECTIHWSKMPSFSERFRDTRVNGQRVHSDENIYTCAGEMASFDFSLDIIQARLGATKSTRLAEYFLGNIIAPTSARQKLPKPLLHAAPRHPLVQAITVMENNIAERKTLNEIARISLISRRQLERLFVKYLKTTPAQYYIQLRLEWGKNLLEQTCIPVIDIAVASGFVTASHFSRSFRNLFSCLPSEIRSTEKGEQAAAVEMA
jgi:transcriptional regulator GlxA family with amidase domain